MRPPLLVALATLAACAQAPEPAESEAARKERARLHARLGELLPRDPTVARALARPGHVQVAIRSQLATAVVREVTRRYLDRVELDLALDKSVRESGSMDVGTPFGKMKAGDWSATVVVHRVRGVLAARA
ncbi:MAG TPA: hypothetical protein VFO85_13225, partial [Vicinamibacteria bacterium]|nr:hypothetical protein [Vicinamibacteria bacterium]